MIYLSKEEKMLFVKSYIQNEIDLDIIQAKTNVKFEKTILTEFESILELSDINNLVAWHKSLNNNTLKVEDLKERHFETSEGKVILGIRYLGMDINKPFVNIWANYSIIKNLNEIIEIAKKEYFKFSPKFVRFYVKPNSVFSIKYNHYKEQSFYINSTSEICKKDYPLNYDKISLERITDLDFFDWYKEIYAKFHEVTPDLKYLVPANESSDFERAIKDKLCYFVKFNNENIGLISGEQDDFLSEKSIYMTEIVLDNKYKGKRLATAIQRMFIEENSSTYKYIWGKISSKNIPSSKNALRIGRKIISSEILLPI